MDGVGRALRPAAPGDLRAGGAGTDEHAWVRLMPWWHAAFVVVFASMAAAAAVELRDDPARLGSVLAILAVWSALYGLFMTDRFTWPRLGSNSHLVYLGTASALFAAANFLYPTCGFLLIVLLPHCFMVLELRPAVAAVIGLTAINVGADLDHNGVSAGTVATAVAFGALGVVLAVLLGGYISRIIAQSLQRAELIDELERTRAELAELSRQTGALAERERLAGEIHDALAQGFTSVLMLIQAGQAALDRGDEQAARRQLALAEPAARDGLAEARSLIGSLAPLHLQGAPLASAIARVCDELGARFGFSASFRIEGEPRPLSHNNEIVLLRAAQEALANAGRHAAARSVHATLSFDDEHAALAVRDDGVGFDTAEAKGFGLAQLRARAAQVGGGVEITSTPGAGTKIHVMVPLNTPPAAAGPDHVAGGLAEEQVRP